MARMLAKKEKKVMNIIQQVAQSPLLMSVSVVPFSKLLSQFTCFWNLNKNNWFPKIASPNEALLFLRCSKVVSEVKLVVKSLPNYFTQRRAHVIRTGTFLSLNHLWHFYLNPTPKLKICEACITRTPLADSEGLWSEPSPSIYHEGLFPLWPIARWGTDLCPAL